MAITTNGITGVGPDNVQTLTNKTLSAPIINNATFTGQQSGLQIAFNDAIVFEGTTADANELTLSAGEPTADRVVTLPNATTTLVGRDTTDTLTNKTLTSPVISTIVNTGTLTLPTTTGTLALTTDIPAGVVTETGTQTLSNKTLTAPKFATAGEIDDANGAELIKFPATVASAVNEITVSNAATAGTPSISATGDDTNINLNLVAKGSGTVQAGGVDVVTTSGSQTLTNKTLTSPTVGTQASFDNRAEARFLESTANGTNYVGFKAPASITTNLVWTLPSADGTANQVLSTDGSGVLSFATASSGGVSANDQAFAFAVQVFA